MVALSDWLRYCEIDYHLGCRRGPEHEQRPRYPRNHPRRPVNLSYHPTNRLHHSHNFPCHHDSRPRLQAIELEP